MSEQKGSGRNGFASSNTLVLRSQVILRYLGLYEKNYLAFNEVNFVCMSSVITRSRVQVITSTKQQILEKSSKLVCSHELDLGT